MRPNRILNTHSVCRRCQHGLIKIADLATDGVCQKRTVVGNIVHGDKSNVRNQHGSGNPYQSPH